VALTLISCFGFQHYRRFGVRRSRVVAGLGEGIQRVARAIDANWQSPLAKLSPQERMSWSRHIEGLHWGFLIGSAAPIALAFHLGFTTFGAVVLLFNVPLNVYPIVLQRYTRAKLARIGRRRRLPKGPQVAR
jgi:hypothetical protein